MHGGTKKNFCPRNTDKTLKFMKCLFSVFPIIQCGFFILIMLIWERLFIVKKGKRIMKKELDLSGLKLVYWGLILQLISWVFIGRLATALMNGAALSGIVLFVISAIALCIILAGISRLNEASPFFKKAKKPFLIQLVLQIIMCAALIGLGARGWAVSDLAYTPASTNIEMLLVGLVILVVIIVTRLISVRAILRGCGHVAEQVNDPMFSLKCLKGWRLWYMAYLLLILMFLAGTAVIMNVVRKTIENGTAGENLSQEIIVNAMSSALLVAIVAMVILVYFVIAHILFIGKIRTTYREYHLEEIKEAPMNSQPPVFADYVQRETNGLQEDGETEEWDETEEWEEEDTEVSADTEEKLISGRRYRRIEESSEEEEADSGDLLEIAKLFKKK